MTPFPSFVAFPPNGTIFDRLDDAGVTWKDYCSLGPVISTTELYPELYARNVGTNVLGIEHFFEHAAAGQLPGFSLVEPNYLLGSEEDPQNIASRRALRRPGHQRGHRRPRLGAHASDLELRRTRRLLRSRAAARAIAPDNIPPDTPPGVPAYSGFAQYGFRVPCVVVSPWARPNYVSHQIYDHTSICAIVEAKWNLP